MSTGTRSIARSWPVRALAWLWPAAPARRLAVVRIAVGTFATLWLVGISLDLLARAGFDPARFHPVGLAAWTGRVAPAVVATALVATIALGIAWVLGLRHRVDRRRVVDAPRGRGGDGDRVHVSAERRGVRGARRGGAGMGPTGAAVATQKAEQARGRGSAARRRSMMRQSSQ
jgi:hypothetical protein